MSLSIPYGGSGTPDTERRNAEVICLPIQHPFPSEEGVFDSGHLTRVTELVHGSVPVGRKEIDWTLEVPVDPTFDGIAIISPGYLGIKQSSRGLRHALAQDYGIATATYTPDCEDDASWREIVTNPQEIHAKALGAVAADLRFRRSEIKKHPGGEMIQPDKLLLIAHSMGGLAIPRFAYSEPGSVYKMVGLMTCGFGFPTVGAIAFDTPSKLLGCIRHELKPAVSQGHLELSIRNVADAISYCRRLRFIFEGISCLREDMRPLVSHLAERGVPYDYLAGRQDFLVRPAPTIANSVSFHKVLEKAGHLLPQANPGRTAHEIAERIAA